MVLKVISKEESRRLHTDWWGECRTCIHWTGTDEGDRPRWNPGICTNSESKLFRQETQTGGNCSKWDSFDIETALELMREDEENF